MANDEELADVIEENAQKPKRASGDIGSVEQHSLKDQIEADRYLASRRRRRRPYLALRFAKLTHGGPL